jgi:hypothetical protein
MQPVPVNTSLNRDILGKILSETRQLLTDELNSTTITSGNHRPVTLGQLIKYCQREKVIGCCEPGCDAITMGWIRPSNLCGICGDYVCVAHMYEVVYKDMQYCHECVRGHCESCGVGITYSTDRVCHHDCE